jgi:site-specific DNA recombinase
MTALPLPETETPAVIYLRVSTKEQAERGGQAEGFSIPAQREACVRRAEQLGAVVVEEFIDAGESAKSSSRPDLQRMLKHLAEQPTRYVIVHKVDRLARNRADDVEINLAIKKAGATLVSVSENIDQTPSGMLLHGIMSSIAEFYSQNLAAEIIKGTETKVKLGGTPTLAPIGYLNVRRIVDGQEIRTIELDSERAPHIRWAFEAYASGDWTLNRITAELEARGLTRRPTRTREARPLPVNKVHEILRNRYYMGVVTWRGIEYPGKHEPLIDPTTFEQVQTVLQGNRTTATRPRRNCQYLAGSIFCGRCGSRLIYSASTGKSGVRYGYWICNGRHNKKNGCDLPALPDERVDAAVVMQWRGESLPAETVAEIREGLLADLADYDAETQAEARLLAERVHAIKRERYKWAEKAMEEAVPRDIAKAKQDELAAQLGQAEEQLARHGTTAIEHEQLIRAVTDLISDCGRAYEEASDTTRRAYNLAWFDHIYIDADAPGVVTARPERTEVVQAFKTATVRPGGARPASGPRFGPRKPNGRGPLGYRVHSVAQGVITPCLVEVAGIEPASSVASAVLLRAQCAVPLLDPAGHAHKPA